MSSSADSSSMETQSDGLPAPGVLDAGAETFPILTEAQLSRVRTYGKLRSVDRGEILARPGDIGMPFFVLLSAGLEIVQPGLSGERQIAHLGPGAFTGEVSMLSGQRCLVLARITEQGELVEISPDGLKSLVARDAELSEIVMRAFILRRLALITNNLGNVILLGSRHSAATLRLREFLARNGYPNMYVDLDTDTMSQQLLDRFEIRLDDVPVVICDGRTVLRNPSTQELADCLGFNAGIDSSQARDLIIVGAGPAGLAAAVYAASEGLDALLIETEAPGGQAGSSSKIENYLGFPTGISGHELASRAVHQAQKFGAKLMIAHSVAKLHCGSRLYRLELEDGSVLTARAVVIATGAQYNRPAIDNLTKFEGQGVYYAATYVESQLCEGEEVVVVGGANLAGQAAVFLSQTARKVHLLVRSGGLAETMSRYLIQRITENPAIELHCNTEVIGLEGETELERVRWIDKATRQTSTREIRHVFMMTGASPRTEWLKGCLALDDKGFILTGRDLDAIAPESPVAWPLDRPPHMLETSLPGVFGVGDVRSGSVKRVASAVGEGAIAVHLVHRALAEL